MLFHPRAIAPPLFSLLLAFGLFTCSRTPSTHPQSLGDTPDPAPTEVETFAAQSSRYLGQESFLSFRPGSFWYDEWPGPIAAVSKGEQREIQEADLYAFGVLGQDVVYALNPYRGLQVLRFDQTLGQKALVGRVPPSPYSAIEMYRPSSEALLILVERMDTDAKGHWIPEPATRLAIYSVQNPYAPRFLQEIKVPGDYTDSRLVGKILYVATTLAHYQDNTWDAQAKLSAFALSPEGLKAADDYVAPLPLRSRDSLQVLQTEEEGQLHTYAILTLQANLWSAWNRESTLEWVDLSDPSGHIQPLLRVTTEGQVRERSASFVRDKALIAVSNSWLPQGEQMIRRVSVESFALPTADAPVISRDEAKQRLAANPSQGLKGVFVRSEDGKTLEKPYPDAKVQTQDDTGLHADIQDVRVSGDLLYVFWVPANQVDPLDIFDIRNAAKEIRYIQRTEFPGWVERAFPLTYQGANYILALGWLRPEGSDRWQRQAQALLFAISPTGDAKVEAQLTLKGDSVWSYFNDQDKTISWLPLNQSSGRILFPMQAGGEEPLQGAKLVHYQLDPPKLSEGPTLAANSSGWLRRVFANKQLERFQTLSDRYFDSFAKSVYLDAQSAQLAHPEASIELARDILAYHPLGSLGLQIVRKNTSWRDESGLELRLTRTPDGERSTVLALRELPGQLVSSYALDRGHVAILAQNYLELDKTWLHLISLNSSGQSLVVTSENLLRGERTESLERKIAPFHRPQRQEMQWGTLKDGSVVFDVFGQIARLVPQDKTWKLSTVALSKDCRIEGSSAELKVFAGQAYLTESKTLEDSIPDRQTHRIEKVWLRSLHFDAGAPSCGAAVNIPGRPLALSGQELICEDQRIIAWQKAERAADENPATPAYPLTRRVLIGLLWDGHSATLQDLYDAETIVDPIRLASPLTLGFLRRQGDESTDSFHTLTLSGQARFVQKFWLIPWQQRPQEASLVAFEQKAFGQKAIVAWREGHTLGLYRAAEDASVLERIPVWERSAEGDWVARDEGYLPSASFWFWRSTGESFERDPVRGTLTTAQGLWGVSEWYVPELTSSP